MVLTTSSVVHGAERIFTLGYRDPVPERAPAVAGGAAASSTPGPRDRWTLHQCTYLFVWCVWLSL
jgi:hypothetical protein